jgi:hypothetical protein
MRRLTLALLTLSLAGLAGCDQLGIESATQTAARREAEGKAIGAGCRHAARSVESCYALNKKADKASVFAGWKEMNEYMAENKIEAVPPPPEPTTVASAEEAVSVAEPKKAPKGEAKKAGSH